MNREYKILHTITSSAELKQLSIEQLCAYAEELRQYIIEECATNPGHLSSSLGVVELTCAIHYVFDTPSDKLVWDVGHQTYPHKIITGRFCEFRNKRQKGGISGFPKMNESEYDSFGGGHASVSISAAFGMAKAAQLSGGTEKVVAVIGDGSMTGGLAFEGLNNAGANPETDMLVILNDNHMSIDNSTGALSNYLLGISTSKRYNRFKQWLWRGLSNTPRLLSLCQRAGNLLKHGILRNSNLFESLNFRYFGVVDGHNIPKLVKVLSAIRDMKGPKLLHVMTVKGKGYTPAENNTEWHAPGKFDPQTGEKLKSTNTTSRYQDVFGETLVELARQDKRVVGITPAMLSGCSMNILAREIPERCFDVGIAEGHAVTFSAGVAASGMIPFCNIYSTFMQRAYDNVIHDVAIQRLPVVMCLDRGGLVGEDGATHHGVFDMAYFAAIPNLTIAAPRNEAELRNMMYTALTANCPFVIRYPRGCGEGVEWRGREFEAIPIGQSECIKEGRDLAIITIGTTAKFATKAIQKLESEGYSPAHYDMRYVKPLDEDLIRTVSAKFSHIITVEDGSLRGGVGEAISAIINRIDSSVKVHSLGVPDRFVDHGTPAELYAECGFDEHGIFAAAKEILA
ncbi:MAG: 1-deoxy-D-xylulose-5-phosphate synthase [Rikenellaceae bacterium]